MNFPVSALKHKEKIKLNPINVFDISLHVICIKICIRVKYNLKMKSVACSTNINVPSFATENPIFFSAKFASFSLFFLHGPLYSKEGKG